MPYHRVRHIFIESINMRRATTLRLRWRQPYGNFVIVVAYALQLPVRSSRDVDWLAGGRGPGAVYRRSSVRPRTIILFRIFLDLARSPPPLQSIAPRHTYHTVIHQLPAVECKSSDSQPRFLKFFQTIWISFLWLFDRRFRRRTRVNVRGERVNKSKNRKLFVYSGDTYYPIACPGIRFLFYFVFPPVIHGK